MLFNDLKLADIITRSIDGSISPNEQEMLDQWLALSEENKRLYARLTDLEKVAEIGGNQERFEHYKNISQIIGHKKENKRQFTNDRRTIMKYAAIVMLMAMTGVGVMMLMEYSPKTEDNIVHKPLTAYLVAESGEQISLDDSVAVRQMGLELDHTACGAVKLRKKEVAQNTPTPVINKIVVPRGCDYTLILSDGTTVCLSAESELEYPVEFTEKDRQVQLKGMAYFDVQRDEARPFSVKTSRSTVTVLGTEFCVADYPSNSNLTTLVSGKVMVTHTSGKEYTLTPGQQAQIDGDNCVVRNVETFYYTAWKDGYFIFREATVKQIMEELSKWYNIDYILNIPEQHACITARIKKYDSIEPIIEILSKIGEVRFIQEENRIIKVSPM